MAKKKKTFAEMKKEGTARRRASYPAISIVTPSFNQAEYLEECIDSVLSQNYPNLEYVIMDGGSTDGSVDIIRKYEEHLTYWQSQPDDGHYAAVSEGFRKTTGEIMGWLNSDDKFHPDGLSILGEVFSRYPQVDFLTARRIGFDAVGNQMTFGYERQTWNRRMVLDERSLDIELLIMQEATYWRRSLWDKAGGYLDLSYKFAADFDLWLRLFRFAQLYTVDGLVAGFRYHGPKQRSQVFRREYNEECRRALTKEKTVASENPDLDGVFPPLISDPFLRSLDAKAVYKNDREAEMLNTDITEESVVDAEKVNEYINQAESYMENKDVESARAALNEALRHSIGNPPLTGMLKNLLNSLEAR